MENQTITTSCTEETVHEQTPRVKNGDSGADFDYVDAGKSYEKLKPVLMEMNEDEIQNINFSLIRSVLNSFKLARAYKRDRKEFLNMFVKSSFNPDDFDNITERAMALWFTDIKVRQCTEPAELRIIAEKAVPVHRRMLKAALYLWDEDEELGDIVASIRSGRSRADMADDIVSMVSLFESRWDYACSRCDLTEDDLVEARTLGMRIMDAMNSTDEGTEMAHWRNMRERAATYLKQGVDSVRSAAAFVFQNDPYELERYPSLFTGRNVNQSSSGNGKATPKERSEALEPKPAANDEHSTARQNIQPAAEALN